MTRRSHRPTDPPDPRTERPIPDPLASPPHRLTDHERAAIAGENDDPDALTGRADATRDDLTHLFANLNPEHLDDGFAGSGDEERPDDEHLSQNDGDRAVESP
jgi:hypothetical protein